jgi:hypothetical protein
MSNKIWRHSSGKSGESPVISRKIRANCRHILFYTSRRRRGRVLQATRVGLIVARGSPGRMLSGPRDRPRALVGATGQMKKDGAPQRRGMEERAKPCDSYLEEQPGAEHLFESNTKESATRMSESRTLKINAAPKIAAPGRRCPKAVVSGTRFSYTISV